MPSKPSTVIQKKKANERILPFVICYHTAVSNLKQIGSHKKLAFFIFENFVSEQQNLFPQHMFPARLNWETFASATMFPSLARPLDKKSMAVVARRTPKRHEESVQACHSLALS